MWKMGKSQCRECGEKKQNLDGFQQVFDEERPVVLLIARENGVVTYCQNHYWKQFYLPPNANGFQFLKVSLFLLFIGLFLEGKDFTKP